MKKIKKDRVNLLSLSLIFHDVEGKICQVGDNGVAQYYFLINFILSLFLMTERVHESILVILNKRSHESGTKQIAIEKEYRSLIA